MDEVKGRVVAACCLDDTVPLFEGVKGFVYIKDEVAFGFCHLLGFELMPRLKNIYKQVLYRPKAGEPNAYPNLKLILTRPINWDLIKQQYQQMIKYATAMRLGTAETEAILRRFTSKGPQHPTYLAFLELGRAVKTIFLCRYLESEALRREIQEGLNVIENWNGANSFIPRRVVTVIEGESMVNDATGLVLYRFAVAAVVTGSFSLWQVGLQFVLVSLGGLLIGLVIAWLHRHLNDAPIEITITLLTPYAAYLASDALQVSGVLAVLAAGLYLSRQSSRFFSSTTRLSANAVWNVLVFLLNGLLFLLIGLQLHRIVAAIADHSLLTLLWQALLVGLVVIAVRLAWVFPAASLPRRLSARLRARDPYPGWRNVAIVAWVGMRGGLSLAAALALPLTLGSGAAFPQREVVIFFTFAVILLTLVGQGLSLGPLIRLLGVRRDSSLEREHALAHQVAARAALARLDELAGEEQMPQDVLARLRNHYDGKLYALNNAVDGTGHDPFVEHEPTQQQLRREILDAERAAVINLRDRGRIDDETLRLVERELDLEGQRS